jgi:hypothetical protein
MDRRIWVGAIAVAALLTSGCASAAAGYAGGSGPREIHVMPDGSHMPGAEHGVEDGTEHGSEPEHETAYGPSDAAQMICAGQVVTAVSRILDLANDVLPSSTWTHPMFTCTYEIDGAPLVLSVHDAVEKRDGEQHFAELMDATDGAKEIEGLLGLGMPSFSTGDGVVAFLRDGKTLVVDATGLPRDLGQNGEQTRHDVAYAVASAVLVCWVEHS